MKKLLGFICIIVLLFACSALAEEAKEYTFQNVPWGSTSEEAVQLLIDSGFLVSEAAMDEGYYGSCPVLGEETKLIIYPNSHSEYDHVMLNKSYSGSMIQKQIAGYDVRSIALSFGINGTETALLCAQIYFAAPNYEEGYADLQSKLETIYGQYEVGTYKSFFETSVWMGENNTAIVLSKDSVSESLFIAYGTLEARTILDECLTNYVVPTNNVDSSDTSGL